MASQQLYIIHGWTYSLDKWQPLLKLLQQAGIKPVMLRVPGLTSTSKQVWDVDSYVSWLDKQLAASSQPIVLGHSNGGRLALNYCLFKPTKIKALILLNSAGVADRSKLKRIKRQLFKLASKLLRPLKRFSLLEKIVYRLSGGSDYRLAPANMKLTLANLLKSDNRLQLSKVTTPTAIIWGSQDRVTPIWQAEKLQQSLQQVTSYNVIDGSGHIPYFSHPDQLSKIIIQLLDSL